MQGRNHFVNPISSFYFYCNVASLDLGKSCKQMVNEEFWEHLLKFTKVFFTRIFYISNKSTQAPIQANTLRVYCTFSCF